MTQKSKLCNGPCGLTKPASEFATRKLAQGRGLVHECKVCQKNRREANKVAAATAKLERMQFSALTPSARSAVRPSDGAWGFFASA